MLLEEKIFKRAVVDVSKLQKYGFSKISNGWVFEKKFMNDDFKAVVNIDAEGQIIGKVFETATDDEFLPLRIENMEGFAGEVRAEYQKILGDIKDKCCSINYFVHPQSNRLTQKILEKYGDSPCFPWDTFSGYGVFKNPDSDKWYALVMNMDFSKLDKKLSGEVEVVNIKLSEDKISVLHKKKGFYPAYHMNKKSWITIVLNDTVTDDELFDLLAESHSFSLGKKAHKKNESNSWLVPANPRYFDIEAAFTKNDEIIWKQSSDIRVGDIAYMYVGAPISAVLYKCLVTEVGIPYDYEDKNLKINKVMKIKLIKKYAKDFMPFSKLNEFDIKIVRGPRICPNELRKVLT